MSDFVIRNKRKKDYEQFTCRIEVELLDKAVTNFFGNELSSETMFLCKEIMNDTLVSTVRNTISNDNDIALSSVFAKENSFMNESFSGQKVWFLYFDNTYAIVVTFNEGEDDTIIMRAEFIFSMNFYNLTLDDIMKIYVNSFGEYSVKIDEIVV